MDRQATEEHRTGGETENCSSFIKKAPYLAAPNRPETFTAAPVAAPSKAFVTPKTSDKTPKGGEKRTQKRRGEEKVKQNSNSPLPIRWFIRNANMCLSRSVRSVLRFAHISQRFSFPMQADEMQFPYECRFCLVAVLAPDSCISCRWLSGSPGANHVGRAPDPGVVVFFALFGLFS